MNDLSTRQLRAFVALADERHFTRAAQRCHVTQPAFSAIIRSLEESLGARLFDRSTRSVDLTPEGHLFELSARRLLGDFSQAQADIGDHLARRRGHVALGALPSLAAGWLPSILAAYHQEYPGVTLTLVDALADICLDKVRAGELDFALAARREDMSGLDSDFLYADRFYVVCPRSHPLATRKSIKPAELGKWPLIHMNRHSSVRQRLEQVLPAKARNVPAFEVEHLATAMGLVKAGLGISVMPAMTLFHVKHPDLAVTPIEGAAYTRPLYLVKRKGRSLSVTAQALYARIMAQRGQIGEAERLLALS